MKRSAPMKCSPLRSTPDTARLTVPVFKPRKCKACREVFTPTKQMQAVCGPLCAHTLIAAAASKRHKAEEKAEKAADRKKREALKTLPDLIKETRAAMHEYVRLRDRAAGHPCICCGAPLRWDVPGGAVDAGHFRSVGSAPHLRFDERNVHAQRSRPCNKDLGGNAIGYRKGLIERIGLAAVEVLEADQTPRKYSRDELRALRDDFRARVRKLKKEA